MRGKLESFVYELSFLTSPCEISLFNAFRPARLPYPVAIAFDFIKIDITFGAVLGRYHHVRT